MARLRYRREDNASGPEAEKFHHNVYVILLDPKVAKHPTILRMNPKGDPKKPCEYVGMSGSLKSRTRAAVATTLPVLDVLPSKGH